MPLDATSIEPVAHTTAVGPHTKAGAAIAQTTGSITSEALAGRLGVMTTGVEAGAGPPSTTDERCGWGNPLSDARPAPDLELDGRTAGR